MNANNFINLSSMKLEVEGELVTGTAPVTAEPNNDNSLNYIIVGSVGSALVLVLSLVIVFYQKQQMRNGSSG